MGPSPDAEPPVRLPGHGDDESDDQATNRRQVGPGALFAFFAAGSAVGALSWAVCPVVSPRQEPFDTGVGFLLGQSMIAITAAAVGWRWSFAAAFLVILGCYAGQLAYIWSLGGESRAWFALGMITVVPLCLLPLAAGSSAALVARLSERRSRRGAAAPQHASVRIERTGD
jgi:hypothetical protein